MSALPKNVKDLRGQRFGRLLVIELAGFSEKHHSKWKCQCDCGTVAVVFRSGLVTGNTRSCGCLRKESARQLKTTHGHASANKSRVYMVWGTMVKRCHSPTSKNYKDYGARGIAVCERWRSSFESFLADMGEPGPGQSIERERNGGNYEPGNCHWATREEQANNTRANVIINTTGGEKMTMAQFVRANELKYSATRMKIKRGIREINGIKFHVSIGAENGD